jgi:hypothetical protein
MRTFLMVVSTSVLLILVSACDNGDEGKDVPRTVPPATLGTVATPEVTLPPSGKKRIQGTGPVYEA